jgi:hypothetical protein
MLRGPRSGLYVGQIFPCAYAILKYSCSSGVYGAIYVAGMVATLFGIGEMIHVRVRFSYERFKLSCFTGQKSWIDSRSLETFFVFSNLHIINT